MLVIIIHLKEPVGYKALIKVTTKGNGIFSLYYTAFNCTLTLYK